MTDRFKLEEQIQAAWSVVDDLKLLNEVVMEKNPSTDTVANYLLGLETIYQAKFEKLFETFEKMIQEGQIK